MDGYVSTVANIIRDDMMSGTNKTTKPQFDPITHKIIGNKTIEFKDDKKAEDKLDEFKLEAVDSKDEQLKEKVGRPKGIHTPLSKEALEKRMESTSKKKFSKEKYKDNPICKLINITTMNTINKTFLSTKLEKLTLAEMEKLSFGESLMYVIDYYAPKGLDTDHPIIVLGIASLGLGMKVVELRGKTGNEEKVII